MKVVLEAQQACTPIPRGIPVYTIQLIRHLLKRKQFDYALAFFDKDRERNNRQYIEQYFGQYIPTVHECNHESYRSFYATGGESVYRHTTYNALTKTQGDIYHFTHCYPIPTRLEGKMVVTVHDLIPLLFPEQCTPKLQIGFTYWWNKTLEMEPTIIADSEATKTDIILLSGYQNVHVVHLGYDDQFYPKQDAEVLELLKIHSPYILYCGALDIRKNILRILDAFKEVRQDFPNIQLVLAGTLNANDHPIHKKLCEVEGDPQIIIPGYITDYQKQVLMSGASAFLFPSMYEGFGLPVLEAMACGCPVITSNVSSLPEVVGDAAILIDPYDTNALVEAIKKVVSSKEIQDDLRKRGIVQAKRFSWDKTAEQVEKIYSSLV